MQFPHFPVSRDLGDDAGCRNGKGKPISLHQSVVRVRKISYRQPVDQAMVRFLAQSLHSPPHGQVCGTQNIESIDLLRGGERHRPNYPLILRDGLVKLLPPGGSEFFGIIQSGARKTAGEYHRCGCYRACERPPARLIHSGDPH